MNISNLEDSPTPIPGCERMSPASRWITLPSRLGGVVIIHNADIERRTRTRYWLIITWHAEVGGVTWKFHCQTFLKEKQKSGWLRRQTIPTVLGLSYAPGALRFIEELCGL